MSRQKEIKGRVHSFESFGTLDGPGIRFVVFMAGCPLRCKYCHNVDVVHCKTCPEYKPSEIVEMILKNKPYFKASGGGMTVSGGDPVFQPEFLKALLQEAKENGIHTTVDTSLFTNQKLLDEIIPYTDLFMVSLKHFNDDIHQFLTEVSNKQILENLRYLSKKGVRLWLRYLVLPGYTDTKENLQALVKFCKSVKFELIELLAYHEMGVYKWRNLGLKYELANVKPPKHAKMEEIKKLLEKEGFKVIVNE